MKLFLKPEPCSDQYVYWLGDKKQGKLYLEASGRDIKRFHRVQTSKTSLSDGESGGGLSANLSLLSKEMSLWPEWKSGQTGGSETSSIKSQSE